MSAKKDLYSEAKDQMRLSERIVAAIPGFRGYKEKELRRESDKLLRNHLYRKLTSTEEALKLIFQKFSDRRYMDVLSDMDRLVAKFDRVAEKVNHASYGYAGFFNILKVKEASLDRMIDFDNTLVSEAEELIVAVESFKDDLSKGETKNIREKIQQISDKILDFEATLDKRQEVILGVS